MLVEDVGLLSCSTNTTTALPLREKTQAIVMHGCKRGLEASMMVVLREDFAGLDLLVQDLLETTVM